MRNDNKFEIKLDEVVGDVKLTLNPLMMNPNDEWINSYSFYFNPILKNLRTTTYK